MPSTPDRPPDPRAQDARRVDVLVVGAGISGLLAATELVAAGRSVAVVDKGRGVGGRLATRRLGPADPGPDGLGQARADHGAQFFTVRTERFGRFVDPLVASGLVHVWTHGFDLDPAPAPDPDPGADGTGAGTGRGTAAGPGGPDGHPRYAVRTGMTALAKHLAAELEAAAAQLAGDRRQGAPGPVVTTGCRLIRVTADGHAESDDGRRWQAERVLLTAPVPQSMELLGGELGGDAVPATLSDALGRITYAPTLCLLGLLDRPLAGAQAGAWQRPAGSPFEMVVDNQARGTSPVPALTAHLTGEESAARWDDPDESTLAFALAAAQPFLDGATVTEPQLKRWRYATPTVLHPEPTLLTGRLAFAGDAFGAPRVEGAATSGWAAADALLQS